MTKYKLQITIGIDHRNINLENKTEITNHHVGILKLKGNQLI